MQPVYIASRQFLQLHQAADFTCFLALPDGSILEYRRLIDSDFLQQTFSNESLRRFYTDDLGFAFNKALQEKYNGESISSD